MCPKVSVIIPVYNVEEYLKQCVNSVLCQTYKDIEVLLIDDGSTDGSAQICDEYAAIDRRVIVIHKENEGSASARVCGINKASGHYVMFVDSDDWIDANTLKICLRAVAQYPKLDCVLFSYVKEYPDHSEPMHILNKSMYMKNRGLEYSVYRRLFGLYGKELSHPERIETMASCCMKLYTAECASKGRAFDIKEIGSSEDTLFNMYALHGIKEGVYIDRCLYHYRKRGNTQTSTYRPELRKQWGNLFRIMEGIIEEKNLDCTYEEALSNRIALSIVSIGLNAISDKKHSRFQQIQEIRTYLSDMNYLEYCRRISIKRMPLIWKIYIICAKCRFSVVIYVMSRLIDVVRKKRK